MELYCAAIEREIAKQKFGSQPTTLYEPIRYLMQLGGKRLRPALVLQAYSLFKSNWQKIVPAAVAVETFHNFTLMHDDIMDNSSRRRGKPTVHEKWNVNTALLSGDVMLVKVYEHLVQVLPEQKLKETLLLFSHCAAQVCEGQQLDLEFERRARVSEKEYIHMIALKTAVLLGFSLELGARLANAQNHQSEWLRKFGWHLGVAFQIKDDWLDAFGDTKQTGKQVGNDIVVNKKTLLLIHAMEKASGTLKNELSRWLKAKDFERQKKVEAVKEIFMELDVNTSVHRVMEKHFDKAEKCLPQLDVSARRKHDLAQWAHHLRSRTT